MKGNELLDSMGLIDAAYVEAADKAIAPKRRPYWRVAIAAACVCILAGAVLGIYFGRGRTPAVGDPKIGDYALSDKTTAVISYGCDSEDAFSSKSELVGFTEEELFSRENMYAFRGRVSGLTNVTIDFNGEKEYRCIATISVDKVYLGDVNEGEMITVLIPCAIDVAGPRVEDTGIISRLESGMEGIFMPWTYSETSYMEMNGAVLMLRDLAECGIADGMRWVFLETERGLAFARSCYPGARDAETLDDIEAYVTEMLK